MHEALLAGAAGGLLWLDRFQALQIMISRPIVCGPAIGWIAGDLSAGLASGIIFEMLWLRRPPVGGYMPPDGTLASMATAGVAAIVRGETGMPVTAIVLISFLCLFPVSHLGRLLDGILRSSLSRLARRAELIQPRRERRIVSVPLVLGLVLGYSICFAALFPVIVAGSLIVGALVKLLNPPIIRALGSAFYAVPLLGLADLMVGREDRADAVPFLVGLAVLLGGAVVVHFVSG